MILENGKHRHVLDLDPAQYPIQVKQLANLTHGKKVEFVMRKMQQADTLSIETERHEELVNLLLRNYDLLHQIHQRILSGDITLKEVETSVNVAVEESQKTLKKLGRMAVKL